LAQKQINNDIFISGNFNVLHPGHLRLLSFAKNTGLNVIVGIFSDRIAGKFGHVQEKFRLETVQSNIYVDHAFILDQSASSYIEQFKPNTVLKGKEHEKNYNEELDVLKKYGGKLIFSSGETIFSSYDLLNKELSNKNIDTNIYRQYMNRHKINKDRLFSLIEKFSELKICVVGDLIVDEYVICDPLGMSQEEPTIVVTPIHKKKFLGGAGIVAAHASNLGANVNFVTISGEDKTKKYALKQLKKYRVLTDMIVDTNRPTTLKERYRANDKTLLRVSHLRQESIPLSLQNKIFEIINNKIKSFDVLIFSDFNYGCLPDNLIDRITSLCKKNKVKMIADCQSSSQIGDISKYKDMELVTPTEREARIGLKNYDDTIVVLANELSKRSRSKNIFLKLGSEGVLVNTTSKKYPHNTDLLPALSESVKDVSGAGDSMLTVSSLVLGLGGNVWEAALLGSIAASLQINRLGNTPLNNKEIKEAL
jgi:rfaE bifunctional protein kinase chain/domain